MSDLTPRDHSLRVAVLGAVLDTVKAEYVMARNAAEAAFASIRAEGTPQQKALLPDGTEIGLISIKEGATCVEVNDEAELEAWARDHVPGAMEQVISPGVLTDPEVIAMIAACFPGSVREQVRPAVRSALLKEMAENDGKAADKATGEVAVLGTVTRHKPTGEFAYRPVKGARDRIVSRWLAGQLTEVPFGPLALTGQPAQAPAGPPLLGPDPLGWLDDLAAVRGGEYSDEHGFLNPEMAAAHAVLVQGGVTTPPVEAYRMIRDGGVMAERATAWLAEAGLPLDDPREGKDVPWPMTEPGGTVAA